MSAAGTIQDDSVLKIARSYDDHLRLARVGSYASGSATSPLHEVEFAYDAFGQLAADRQGHNGAVDGSTLKRVKELEAEHAKLKRMYADLAMEWKQSGHGQERTRRARRAA